MIHGKYVEIGNIVIDKLNNKGIHFFYFCGGRGIGKTYGACDFILKVSRGELELFHGFADYSKKFLFMRITAVEAQSIASEESNVFKTYNLNEGTCINSDYNSKINLGNFYADAERTEHIGYCASLSTFSNLRGVDFSDIGILLVDEAIPEKRQKSSIKRQGMLMLNAIETINRNRALEGKEELVVIFMSNPIDLGNELLAELGFTSYLNKMFFKGQTKITVPEKSMYIQQWKDHKVSEEKKEKSALYKFATGTGFVERATSGEFRDNDMSVVKPNTQLNDYVPFFKLDMFTVCKHKAKNELFITTSKISCSTNYMPRDLKYVREVFGMRYKLMRNRSLIFVDDYKTLTLFDSMMQYQPE